MAVADLDNFRQTQLHMPGQRHEMGGRQMPERVLYRVQVFNHKIPRIRPPGEQRFDLRPGIGVGLPFFRERRRLAAPGWPNLRAS